MAEVGACGKPGEKAATTFDPKPVFLDEADGADQLQGLSKRKRKKLERFELYAATKKERRKVEKEKRKRRRLEANSQAGDNEKLQRTKICKMENSECKQRIAVDISFDSLMSDKDIMKTLQQLQYCYSANRRAQNPVQLYLVGFTGKTRTKFDATQGCHNWDVNLTEEPYDSLFPKKDCVYLTSESDNILTNLDDSKIYIIGGLVDHNLHKGLCYKMARENGINHARLPIDEHIRMESRKVLTINHVFEILLRFSECKNWETAFFDVIPKRKGLSSMEDNSTDEPTNQQHCDSSTEEPNS